MYNTGDGVARDDGKAAQLHKKACDGGDAGGCYDLGTTYESGADRDKAAPLHQKACSGGRTEACEALESADAVATRPLPAGRNTRDRCIKRV